MRKRREIKANSYYHVVARANRKEFIFEKDEVKELFIKVLGRARKKYKFQIKNFCIMGNHIHLLVKPAENENLSIIMQWILSVFAVSFNHKYNYLGHVWYDRFKSKVVDSYAQYLNVYKYILNNPVKAEIVEKASDYYYCGLTFIKKKLFKIIDPPELFELYEIHSNNPEVLLLG